MLTRTVGFDAVGRSGFSAFQGHELADDITAGEHTNQTIKKGSLFIEIGVVGNNDISSITIRRLVDFDACGLRWCHTGSSGRNVAWRRRRSG